MGMLSRGQGEVLVPGEVRILSNFAEWGTEVATLSKSIRHKLAVGLWTRLQGGRVRSEMRPAESLVQVCTASYPEMLGNELT